MFYAKIHREHRKLWLCGGSCLRRSHNLRSTTAWHSSQAGLGSRLASLGAAAGPKIGCLGAQKSKKITFLKTSDFPPRGRNPPFGCTFSTKKALYWPPPPLSGFFLKFQTPAAQALPVPVTGRGGFVRDESGRIRHFGESRFFLPFRANLVFYF